ncbi:MAG: Rieske (2Fe-2S) protein, partial [Phycisphaerae bacterium]|nr:Rieske (2Fe-2S) protein [Phycisphaerae bacterium]
VSSICRTLDDYRGLPHSRAKTLPAAFYTSPEFLELELEQLFRRQWVCLGRIEEIAQAGDYFATELAGEPLLVVRSAADNKVRVLSNVCRHRGMVLTEGSGNARHFLCPYHAWTYDSQGRLLR